MQLSPPAAAEPVLDDRSDAESTTCRNCGATRHGAYCSRCGQHFLEDRLTFRLLASELWERVTFERGFPATLLGMTVRPGQVIRAYVDGQRRRWVSPLTYVLFGAALSLLVLHLFGDVFTTYAREHLTRSAGAMQLGLGAAQQDAYVRGYVALAEQTTYTSLAVGGLYALLLRLLFRRTGINLAESFVFALFVFGHVYYVDAVVSVITIPLTGTLTLASALTVPIYLVVGGFAAAQYFGRPVRSVLKNSLALLVAFAVFSVVSIIAIAVYVRLTVR